VKLRGPLAQRTWRRCATCAMVNPALVLIDFYRLTADSRWRNDWCQVSLTQ